MPSGYTWSSMHRGVARAQFIFQANLFYYMAVLVRPVLSFCFPCFASEMSLRKLWHPHSSLCLCALCHMLFMKSIGPANKPNAAKPAITSRLHSEYHRRGLADSER